MPSEKIFGLGERNNPNLRLKQGIYTLNARDDVGLVEDGKRPPKNVYSSHPFYLMREQSGKFHAVFLKNSSPMDVVIYRNLIEFNCIGGILHFKIFLCDNNPEECIKLYHDYLGGGHALPPFWAFGFHQSRWGYRSSQQLENVIQSYQKYDIPLDTIWSDIDFMISKQTFSVNYAQFRKEFFESLYEKYKVNYVPIVDVAVGATSQYDDALKKGLEMDIFCRSPNTGNYFKGSVWPGDSYFPDFLNPKSGDYWKQMMEQLHSKTNYTGIWLDMNEPANFCNGSCYGYVYHNSVKEEYINIEYTLPYNIGGSESFINLKTLPYNLLHYGKYEHKDVHNLYGLLDTFYTNKALTGDKIKKIYPFILTRSSFPGSGKYAFKWTGDNLSNWEFLRISIVSIVNFGFFGIPFTGADVCGFMGDTTQELCQRWIQLASLQPFVRNHNHDQAKVQEFYNLGEQVADTARKNLKLRYQLLKHYFMLFVRTNHLGTVYKPLFFEFPDDPNCYLDDIMNNQFMLGKELLCAPVLFKGKQEVKAYFPKGVWYNFYTGLKVNENGKDGGYFEFINGLNDLVPLYLREGYLVGIQSSQGVKTINDLNNEFKLICALKQISQYKYVCEGNLLNLENFNDEKEVKKQCDKQLNPNANCIINVSIVVNTNQKTIEMMSMIDQKEVQDILLRSLSIFGFPGTAEDLGEQENIIIFQDNYPYNINIKFDQSFNISEQNILKIQY